MPFVSPSIETEIALIRQQLEQVEKARTQARKDLDQKLDAILEQATKTNGRVDNLESSRDWMKGAIGVLTAIVVPLVIAVVIKYLI
jgi:type IV secretory pathway component VirB8